MKTTINLKFQGVKGGDPQWQANKGYIATHIEGKENGSVSIDAFEGQGETYKRREIPLVTVFVFHGGKLVYEDNFTRFIEKLQKPEPIHFLFGDDACRIYSEEGIEALTEYIESGEGYELYEYTGDAIELISNYTGWNDYIILSKDEYNKISEL